MGCCPSGRQQNEIFSARFIGQFYFAVLQPANTDTDIVKVINNICPPIPNMIEYVKIDDLTWKRLCRYERYKDN